MKIGLALLGIAVLIAFAVPAATASCTEPGLTVCTTPAACAPGAQCCLIQCNTSVPPAFLPQQLLFCAGSVAGQAGNFGGTAATYAVGLVFGC